MPDDPEEHEWISRATRGDSDAFTNLFNRYYAMIHAFAHRLGHSGADADEITQVTFVKAARSLATVRGNFKSWLFRIAHNTATDHLRSTLRHRRLTEEATAQACQFAALEPDHAPIAEALADLSPDLRAAIVLTFYEGLTHAEAGRVAGCAETTISWRVFIAKRRLKKALSHQ